MSDIRARWQPAAEAGSAASTRFLILAAGWSVLLFAVLRAPWIVAHASLPLTRLQAAIAAWYGGASSARVVVTLECGGADMMALCAGVVLAFPAAWRRRLQGLAFVLPALFVLNIIRIATLSQAADTRFFSVLHVYVWPALLIGASAAFVLLWMRSIGTSRRTTGRAAVYAAYGIGAFALCAPWLASSGVVSWFCRIVATSAAGAMDVFGAHAQVANATLVTARGSFVVTPECVVSPVIPLCVMAAIWLPLARWTRLVALALIGPIVWALATARLLTLGLPSAWVASPLVRVHDFHQIVLFAGLVLLAAWFGRQVPGRWTRVAGRGAAALVMAAIGAAVFGGLYDAQVVGTASRFSAWAPHTLTTLQTAGDVQGAIALLPEYQIALMLALLWGVGRPVRWPFVGLALVGLFASHVALLVGLGEFSARWQTGPHALVIRGWAVLAPAVLAGLLLRFAARQVGTPAFAWANARIPALPPDCQHSSVGHEVLVDAHGCDPASLRSQATLQVLFGEILSSLSLTPVIAPQWHTFGGGGGVTGLQMLSESHLACHTYPETGFAAFSLYCCRPKPVAWPWQERLVQVLGASHVSVRQTRRGSLEAETASSDA